MVNHYAVLNIAMDAPEAVVRAAYRVLAAHFHPDRHAEDAVMLARMQAINQAWRVLSDPRLRAEHDAQLRQGRRRRASDAERPAPVCRAEPILPHASADTARVLARRRASAAAAYAAHATLE